MKRASTNSKRKGLTYAAAGVDQTRKDRIIDIFLRNMRSTYDRNVIELDWSFAGFYRAAFGSLKDPVLVACADGVGTKIKLAVQADRHDTVGIDLVAMNVNDLICTGARPLFFLDYIATGRVDKNVLLQVMDGILEGCRQGRCALLGGETAEMPGVYRDGEYDLAGFAVGVVERERILKPDAVQVNDVILGLPSSGLHSNGFSLVRRILERTPMPLAPLLAPTRIYVKTICETLGDLIGTAVRGLANITGGGMIENIPRVIPKSCDAEIVRGTWKEPTVFARLQKAGNVPDEEMFRVFNMGVGMALIVARGRENEVLRRVPEARVIGRITRGKNRVRIVHK